MTIPNPIEFKNDSTTHSLSYHPTLVSIMATDFDAKVKEAIPGEVHMISGSHDIQTSADVSNVGAFQVRN